MNDPAFIHIYADSDEHYIRAALGIAQDFSRRMGVDQVVELVGTSGTVDFRDYKKWFKNKRAYMDHPNNKLALDAHERMREALIASGLSRVNGYALILLLLPFSVTR